MQYNVTYHCLIHVLYSLKFDYTANTKFLCISTNFLSFDAYLYQVKYDSESLLLLLRGLSYLEYEIGKTKIIALFRNQGL